MASSSSRDAGHQADGQTDQERSGPSSQPLHYFPTPALDHAFAGIMAGAVATVCMNPLDLVKVQFQVDTSSRKARRAAAAASASTAGSSTAERSPLRRMARRALGVDVASDMYGALRTIVRRDGWAGLYRGLTPNVAGNSASWGLYFLFYTMIKERMAATRGSAANSTSPDKLSAGQHLLAASESGAITALITNPIWVVKTRMFTTSKSGQPLYTPPAGLANATTATAKAATTAAAPTQAQPIHGLWQGLRSIWRHEGIRGLYKGGGLALFGVSNGAIQFMTYEELKRWRMEVARRRSSTPTSASDLTTPIKLDNIEYILMSGVSKAAAIGITYPYQVIRSRIQNHATAHIYPTIPTCIRLTWQYEGLRGFYKGMAANAIRIIPGTCVTFVVYENCAWALRGLAQRRHDAQADPLPATR